MVFVQRMIQQFKNLELARKLILINFFLILIPLSVLGSFAYTSFTKTMEENVGDFQLQTLKQVTLNIDTYMNELNRLTLMPYQFAEIIDYLESERDYGDPLTLSEIDQLNNFVSKVSLNGRIDILGVSLYGENGASYVVLPESQYVSTYKLDESAEWLKKAQGRFGQPTFITTHELKSTVGTAYEVFSIARELRSFDTGQRLGYIVIDIDPLSVQKILSQVSLGGKESLYISDRNGKSVIAKEKTQTVPDLGVLSGEGISHYESENGSLLVAYVTSSVTEWTTVGIVPISELTKGSVVVRNSIVLFGLISVGLALLLSVFIAFRITKPLRKLSKLMRQVEHGKLNVSFPVKQSDEVGHLGHAFNRMVSQLSELGYLLYETEIREKDAQIAALQSKINPHFLYNTLGSISMYAEVEGQREIVAMANNLSRLLRYSLSSNKDNITLRDEIEHVEGYMTIQKMRYEDRISFTLDMDEDVLDCQVIPLMIQPIVENAINHGIDKGVGEGNIRVTAHQTDDMIYISVEDDGVGLSTDQLVVIRNQLNTRELGGTTGNGLLNVHRRIVLHYGERYGLTLESMPYQGLKVMIKLPVMIRNKS